MPRRCGPLILAAWLLMGIGQAQAHRLEADYRVLPDGKVQIESWFDLNGQSPHGAQVQVFRKDGQLLTEGRLDAKGLFIFAPIASEALQVVVSAGAGHRKELQIPAEALENTPASEVTSPSTAATSGDSGGVPLVDRSPRTSFKDILIGVAFLLAVAAFILSWRNARQLRRWQDVMDRQQ